MDSVNKVRHCVGVAYLQRTVTRCLSLGSHWTLNGLRNDCPRLLLIQSWFIDICRKLEFRYIFLRFLLALALAESRLFSMSLYGLQDVHLLVLDTPKLVNLLPL